MEFPEELYYSEEHEWLRVENGKAVIGITDHAQDELGDIVFVELPEEGEEFEKDEEFGVIESVKAVSDLYLPVTGTITAIDERLMDEPELVNEDPYGDGWLVEIELTDKDELEELMNSEEYQNFVAEEE